MESVRDKVGVFSVRKYLKRRLPVLKWFPTYKPAWLLQDALAGITVGLTAIPQSIAYAIVAGLSPEYGLYSAFMGCFVYVFFGSCHNITIGPTAIMAVMVQPLVIDYGPDMAVLICFLKGCIIALLSIFHLGFLLDFISLPVITGFTSGAAITIASSQLPSLLGIQARSNNLVDAIRSIFKNFDDINEWDVVLGMSTIIGLVILKNIPGSRTGSCCSKIGWIATIARNAVAVIVGLLITYICQINDMEPFHLTDAMGEELPPFKLPPFSTTFHNETHSFIQMTTNMGGALFTIPLISTIEHIAIAKAFSMGKPLDTTQEMLALGLCNIFGSFVRSMPVTGSFTRTAVNHSSGVRTVLGGIFTGALVLLAARLLATTLQHVPKATLAAVIICAMYYLFDFRTYHLLWRAKKIDFLTMMVTLLICVFASLEIGIVVGVVINLIVLLYFSARPSVDITIEHTSSGAIVHVTPEEALTFPAAENLRANIMNVFEECSANVILDCKNLKRIDVTVAKNIKLLAHDINLRDQELIYVNSSIDVKQVLSVVAPELSDKFKDLEHSCL